MCAKFALLGLQNDSAGDSQLERDFQDRVSGARASHRGSGVSYIKIFGIISIAGAK